MWFIYVLESLLWHLFVIACTHSVKGVKRLIVLFLEGEGKGVCKHYEGDWINRVACAKIRPPLVDLVFFLHEYMPLDSLISLIISNDMNDTRS